MSDLSLRELATVINGNLYLGDLPPIDSDQQAVCAICFDLNELSPGGLYWDLSLSIEQGFGKPELAFAHGAAGILTEHQHSEPWAGRYTLRVESCQRSLRHLAYFLRRRARQQVLFLCPAVSGPRVLAAMQLLSSIPPANGSGPCSEPLATMTHVCTGPHLQIHALGNLQNPSLFATLLLATPDLIILGRSDANWLRQQTRETLHRILESLPPDGAMLYCDCPKHPPTSKSPVLQTPPWMQFFVATGIRCLRIGADDNADVQIRPTAPSGFSFRLKMSNPWLRGSASHFEQAVAEATAIGAAILLGHDPTSLSRRFALPSENALPGDSHRPPRDAA